MTLADLAFLVAYLSPLLLGLLLLSGLPHPRMGPAGRLGAGFALGTVLTTWWATCLSLVGIPWSLLSIGLPLLALAMMVAWRGRNALAVKAPGASTRQGTALLLIGLSALYLVLALLAAGATSVDLFYFWGVKSIHFLLARGLDASVLSWRYALHAHSNYPPLLPISFVWAALASGGFSWWGSILTTAVWWAATVPLVAALLRPRLGRSVSFAVTAFWAAALALSLAASHSGGNAEAPLLFFLTVAGCGLLGETEATASGRRWIVALALAGAVLSKNEGLVEAGLLVAAALATDLLQRKPQPLKRLAVLVLPSVIAYAPWLTFELVHGLPISDPTREPLFPIHIAHWSEVARLGLENLGAGSWGLTWILPLLLALLFLPRLSKPVALSVLPGLTFVSGMFLFFAFYYLHFPGDPSELVAWSLSRISQPALSLWIVTAACGSIPSVDTSRQL